jgi:hypothetical protein
VITDIYGIQGYFLFFLPLSLVTSPDSYSPSGMSSASAIPESRGFDWLLRTKNTLSVAPALAKLILEGE